MNDTIVPSVLQLPKELATAMWSVTGTPDDDHKLEGVVLPDNPGIQYLRKKGNPTQVYVRKDSSWKCAKCGAGVLAASVAHTIRDGLFPCSGSGEVWNETVPYCPTCEKQPNFYGSPIYPR